MIRIEIQDGAVSLCQVRGVEVAPRLDEALSVETGVGILPINEKLYAFINGKHKEICANEVIMDLYLEGKLQAFITDALESIREFKETVPETAIFTWYT